MSVIQGVGDEVTLFSAAIFITVFVALLYLFRSALRIELPRIPIEETVNEENENGEVFPNIQSLINPNENEINANNESQVASNDMNSNNESDVNYNETNSNNELEINSNATALSTAPEVKSHDEDSSNDHEVNEISSCNKSGANSASALETSKPLENFLNNNATLFNASKPQTSNQHQNCIARNRKRRGFDLNDLSQDDSENIISRNVLHPTPSSSNTPNEEIPEQDVSPAESQRYEDWKRANQSISREEISIRIKYITERQRIVRATPMMTIKDFKRIYFSEDLSNQKVVRLIYKGHLLQDDRTFHSYDIRENQVIHAHISNVQQQATSPIMNSLDLDLSNYFWPLLTAILGAFWVCFIKYPEFFSFASLSILFIFTGTFAYFYIQFQL